MQGGALRGCDLALFHRSAPSAEREPGFQVEAFRAEVDGGTALQVVGEDAFDQVDSEAAAGRVGGGGAAGFAPGEFHAAGVAVGADAPGQADAAVGHGVGSVLDRVGGEFVQDEADREGGAGGKFEGGAVDLDEGAAG